MPHNHARPQAAHHRHERGVVLRGVEGAVLLDPHQEIGVLVEVLVHARIAQLEEEIKRLKDERRLKGPLLNSVKKYFDICEDEKELAASASDQSRLLGRGPRDPGRLLREEKMRKRVTKEKPRVSFVQISPIAATLKNLAAGTGSPCVATYMGS